MTDNLSLAAQLSAVMDGAVDDSQTRDRVLEQLTVDPGLRAYWLRYHLYGDAIRGQLPARLDLRLVERLRSALAAEPVPLADEPRSH